jgi:hypothetical protein
LFIQKINATHLLSSSKQQYYLRTQRISTTALESITTPILRGCTPRLLIPQKHRHSETSTKHFLRSGSLSLLLLDTLSMAMWSTDIFLQPVYVFMRKFLSFVAYKLFTVMIFYQGHHHTLRTLCRCSKFWIHSFPQDVDSSARYSGPNI